MELPDIKDMLPGAVGSLGAAWLWLKGPRRRRAALGALGMFASYYGSPYVAKMFDMSQGLAGFMLGLFGMAVVDSIFQTWGERGLTAMIRDFVSAIRGTNPRD